MNQSLSIFIAVRNEEKSILNCLESLNNLQNIDNQVFIYLGDDHSEDNTTAIISNFIQNKPHFQLLSSPPNIKGKAKTLAHLTEKAQGEIFFFTDADTQVPPMWITSLLPHFQGNTGVLAAWTLPIGHKIFHHLQTLEWLWIWLVLRFFAYFKIPITAMGNNLAISRLAYEKVGGYKKIPFSITEDLAIFRAIIKQGLDFQVITNPVSLAFTQATDTWLELLQQRKRWLRGAMQLLPLYQKIGMFLSALLLPSLLVLFFFHFWLILTIFTAKIILQNLLIINTLQKIQKLNLAKYLILFEVYSLFVSILTLIFYILPFKIEWKNRKYN